MHICSRSYAAINQQRKQDLNNRKMCISWANIERKSKAGRSENLNKLILIKSSKADKNREPANEFWD
jgi:hypothetical protein